MATKVMSEEEIYRITVEWEKQYGFSALWDYQVNAAFSAETRTIPYNAYVFDFSLLPVMPDEDAIPAEKIAENAREFINTIIKLKPAAAKGTYIKSIYLSSTMSRGVKVDPKAVDEI